MNEKLEILVEQANKNRPFECSYSNEQWLETFAKLIICECASLFDGVYTSIETEHGYTSVNTSEYIKKHFGVKE